MPGSQSTKNRYPTKKQFLANRRAKRLRTICLKIAETMKALLDGNVDDEQQAIATIEALSGQRIDMGIWKNTQVGKPQSAYSSPVIMAEFSAGQLLKHIGSHIPTAQEILPIVQEFAEECAIGKVARFAPGTLPKPIRTFLFNYEVIAYTYRYFDEPLQR